MSSTWKRLAEKFMRFSVVDSEGEATDNMGNASSGTSDVGNFRRDTSVRLHADAASPASGSTSPARKKMNFLAGEDQSADGLRKKKDANSPFGVVNNSTDSSSNVMNFTGAVSNGKWYKKDNRNALSDALAEVFQFEILSDLIVYIEDEKEEIRAHCAILACQSTFFRKLIERAESIGDFKDDFEGLNGEEEKCLRITLSGMSYDVAEKIIGFLYSGKIQLSDANVIDVFLASDVLNVKELKYKCEEHVSSFISCDSLQVLLSAARAHSARELEKRCISFFQNNAENVLLSESLLEISESILIDLLCKDFYISNEQVVFEFVVKWGKLKRRHLASKAVKSAESSLPSVEEIVSKVMKYVRLISIPKSALERTVAWAEVVEEELLLEVLFRKLQSGLVYSAGETYETPDAIDAHGRPVKFYLKPRKGTWKKFVDFPNEAQYAEYMKSVLRPGMLLKAANDYEQVRRGDVGEFVQFNTGVPPCQIRWQIYGNTYWLHWKDLEIVN